MGQISRRRFIKNAEFGMSSVALLADTPKPEGVVASRKSNRTNSLTPDPTRYALERNVTEWVYSSGKVYSDPFNDIELDVVFTDPRGQEQRVPVFWIPNKLWELLWGPLLHFDEFLVHLESARFNSRTAGQKRGCRVSVLLPTS